MSNEEKERLLSEVAPLVKGYVRKFGTQDNDDYVQEALIEVWEALDKFDPKKGLLGTWAIQIAKNAVSSYRRRNCIVKANGAAKMRKLTKLREELEGMGVYSSMMLKAVSGLSDKEFATTINNFNLMNPVSIHTPLDNEDAEGDTILDTIPDTRKLDPFAEIVKEHLHKLHQDEQFVIVLFDLLEVPMTEIAYLDGKKRTVQALYAKRKIALEKLRKELYAETGARNEYSNEDQNTRSLTDRRVLGALL